MSEHPWFRLLNGMGMEQLAGLAIGSTVLGVCWLILMRILRSQSASVHSGVWQATCSGIVLTAFVLFAVPGVPLKIEPTAAVEAERSVLVTSLQNPVPPNFGIQQHLSTPTAFSEPTTTAEPLATDHLTPTVFAPADADASNRSLDEPDTLPAMQSAIDLPSVLAAVWIGVFSYLLIVFGFSIVRCRSIIATASREVPSNIREVAELVRKGLGLHQCPRVVLAEEFRVPFTAGIFRPIIVLPTVAVEWSTEKTSMVLAHEMAHVERHDVLWHWIGRLAVCIAWFNPLVWFAAKRGFLDRERACDDRVIGAGFAPTDYGQSLVEVAASLSGVRMPHSAIVSMAEPPLKQRLLRILSATADRRCASTRWRGTLIAAFACIAIILGVVRPLAKAPKANAEDPIQATEPTPGAKEVATATGGEASNTSKPSSDKAADDDLIELTKPVSGMIIDEDGNPIAEAAVVVKLMDWGGETSSTFRQVTIRRWETTSDASGRYTVDVAGLGPQPSRYCFGVDSVDKSGYAQGRSSNWPSAEDVAAGKEIRAVKLTPGRRITGQFITASGEPIAGLVKAAAAIDSETNWYSNGTLIDASGRLEIDIPLNADAVIVVYAEDHSPVFVSIPRDQNDVGRILLSDGTLVKGRVVDRNDKPAAGVVVCLDSSDRGLRGIAMSRVALTDADGKFSLEPAAGDCRISVLPFSFIRDRIGGDESIVGRTPPLILPSELKLPAERGIQEVLLKETESFRISGSATWDDGTPAENFEIKGGTFQTGTGIDLAFDFTDDDGRYEIRLPKNSNAYLSGLGAYRDNERSVWYMARGSAPSPAHSGSQIISFDELQNDIDNVNWELRVYRASPPRTAAQEKVERAFKDLQQEYKQQLRIYQGAQFEDQDRLDPRNVMAAKYLDFEKEHRGEKQAIQAIVKVMQGANSVAREELPVAKARVEVVERLIDHYLGHEDLADTFGALSGGPDVPRADDLLRLAYGRSPHPAVRAESLLVRAERAKAQLRDLEHLPEIAAHVALMVDSSTLHPSSDSPESVKQMADLMQRRLDALKAINPDKLRTEAISWLDIIEKEYADLERPHTFGHTFGQDAKALRFAIEHVNVGQQAPVFEATDIHGKPFRLSDHLGKVVVISFNQAVDDEAKNLAHQKLAEQFSSESLELVTIVATSSQEKFVANAKAADLKGTLIWEPLRGPYHSNWGVTGFPTTYIVDQNGKLHGTPVVATDVSREVQSLMTNESGPNAMQRYQLQPGENVRRVAPPFPVGRMEYYRKEHARQAELMPNGPSTMGFTWKDGELKGGSMHFGEVQRGNPVAELLTTICKVGPQFLRGDDDLLRRHITGDYVVRSDASPEEVIADFEKILSAEWKTKITLQFNETEEDVYVARGGFELSKLAQDRGLVIIEGANQGGHDSIEEALSHRQVAMRPPFGHFVESSIAEAIGFPVINEVENPPDVRVFYNFLRYRFPENVSGFEIRPSGSFIVPPEPILKSVSDQTGLTFTQEKRMVKTLTLKFAY
jgi:beta-lactamase regulating signal transducer with metallopeptidase domain